MTTDLESPSVGIDRRTGDVITGWDHVLQSLEDIFTTRFGERVMREWYGSVVPALLGRNANRREILSFFAAMSAAIDQFEPRVRVAKVNFLTIERDGHLGAEIVLLYRPRALLGDFTVEGTRKVGTLIDDDGARLRAA